MNKYNKIAKKWANRYEKVYRKLHKKDLWGSFPNVENKRSEKCKRNHEFYLSKAMQSGDFSLV